MFKRSFLISLLTCLSVFCFSSFLFAEKIAIVYTGDTNASLYPCRCPKAPNGGVTRRATKIKELRKDYLNLLVLDSGNYFASGTQDVDKQTLELDKKRTNVNLQAMKVMAYDAVGIGKEEFNFGKEFLIDAIKNININFLSCNLNLPGVSPYIIKKIGKTKVGIIGVSPLDLNIEQTSDSKHDFSKVSATIRDNMAKLKKQKADVIILLSQLGQEMDKQLVEQVKGIDIIISNQINSLQAQETKLGSAVYLKPYLWARSLGFAELDVEKGKINDFTTKELPLSQDMPVDPDIESFLPRCFQDSDCYKPDVIGKCKLAGEREASCVYEEQVKVSLLIITPKVCKTCNVEESLNWIKTIISNISVSYLDGENKEAKRIIENLDIEILPAFLLGKEISKHNNYDFLLKSKIIEEKDDYYLMNPSFVGVSYFLNRSPKKNRLDLFVSLRDKGAKSVLDKTKRLLDKSEGKIDFQLHLLAAQDMTSGNFIAPYGTAEIGEDKIALCAIEKYPQKIWDYLFCHIDNLETKATEVCLTSLGSDADIIKKCAESEDGDNLLKENIKLSEELKIFYGPLFLWENQEIFGVRENTTVEELERIINR